MVVDEHTESILVTKRKGRTCITSRCLLQAIPAHEHIPDREKQRVVQRPSQWASRLLEPSNKAQRLIKHFADLIHASSSGKLTPECLRNFWDSVDSNAIKPEGVDQPLDPGCKLVGNVIITLI